jgi:hypothetical protein
MFWMNRRPDLIHQATREHSCSNRVGSAAVRGHRLVCRQAVADSDVTRLGAGLSPARTARAAIGNQSTNSSVAGNRIAA